ncbi:MAG: DUF1724 domain-containing protein [Methanolinea sp.]|nr:DUF1724 domain-containing protein [Methanolinea sp.]
MDHPTRPGEVTATAPSLHFDAADISLIVALYQGPATLPEIARSSWLEESQVSLILERLIHRWVAGRSGEYYLLTRSGQLLGLKIHAFLEAMSRYQPGCGGQALWERARNKGVKSLSSSKHLMEWVEGQVNDTPNNAGASSVTLLPSLHRGKEPPSRFIRELADLRAMVRTMERFIDFFESHSLEGIPQSALESLGDLVHAELICDISCNFLHRWEKYLRILQESRWIHGVSAFATPHIADAIGERVREGVKVILVITPELAEDLLKEPYLEMARHLWEYRNLKFRVSRVPIRVGLTVTDKALSFGLFTRSGQIYDSVYDLVCRSPESLEWGERLFLYYVEHSDPLPKYVFKTAFSSLFGRDTEKQ